MTTRVVVEFLNPSALNKNPAFTNVVVVTGSVKTIHIGGQDSVDASGGIVGKGDFRAQAQKLFEYLQAALAAEGAELHHLVKWNIFVVHGQDLRAGLEVFQKAWGPRPNPPTITVLFVSGPAHPDFLLEMDAVAVVPD